MANTFQFIGKISRKKENAFVEKTKRNITILDNYTNESNQLPHQRNIPKDKALEDVSL